jgi:class 3 adenylate cyclase
MASTRRLTAILAADVAGYSRLVGTDEEGTHERLRGHLGQLVEPKIREHKGRTVKKHRRRPVGGISECRRRGAPRR